MHEDLLSPLAHELINVPTAYARLVVPDETPPDASRLLRNVTPRQLLAVPIVEPIHGGALLAGLWLWHDALPPCHEIVQREPDEQQHELQQARESLAFWHAILHRREGDFSNAKYWYARCRNHPALALIPRCAEAEVEHKPDLLAFDRVVRGRSWDGSAFVDLVQDVYRDENHPRRSAVIWLQRIEWRVLFESCAKAAAGG